MRFKLSFKNKFPKKIFENFGKIVRMREEGLRFCSFYEDNGVEPITVYKATQARNRGKRPIRSNTVKCLTL